MKQQLGDNALVLAGLAVREGLEKLASQEIRLKGGRT